MTEDTNLSPPVKYGSFNNRMMAWAIDICALFIIALPLVNALMNALFVPIDENIFTNLINSPEFHANPAVVLWQGIRQQPHLIERIVLENLLQVGCIALYALPFWFRYSATPGKMLLRLQIRDAKTGAAMSRKQAVIRFLGYFISTLPLMFGFIWIFFNKERRGFHDLIAGTVVVVKPRKRKE